MYSAPYSFQILMKLNFSPQIFEKYLNIKFHEILPVRAELFQADRLTDMTKLTDAVCNSVNALKTVPFPTSVH
jgi:hypothetical protein